MTLDERIARRRVHTRQPNRAASPQRTILLCVAVLSGLFLSVILVEGSYTVRLVTALLLWPSTFLFVAYVVLRERFWKHKAYTNAKRSIERYRALIRSRLATYQGVDQSGGGDPDQGA